VLIAIRVSVNNEDIKTITYINFLEVCYPGLLCCVIWRKLDVSEVYATSIFRVEEQVKQETSRSGWQNEIDAKSIYDFITGIMHNVGAAEFY
jgi:hypothetical protein